MPSQLLPVVPAVKVATACCRMGSCDAAGVDLNNLPSEVRVLEEVLEQQEQQLLRFQSFSYPDIFFSVLSRLCCLFSDG